ncbi:TonB-dependent receptor [uncultured Bacteroides sp.]|mgnify:FL=1|uniref:SusC/RagA family TonB-linked outer membrane protein n=1 Tax=uncultured Bacteroides sp. TaxID=162156 RepID=UPI0025996EA4|nr:TonB-dependent receptor [uncultured Bacteroides sp.]
MKYFISILTVFIISVNAMFAQSGLTAAGLVMTQDGESVIGATVTVKEDPGKGVITDTDGRFKMNGLSKGQTLVISYIGYKDATVKVTKTDERMRIVLEEDISDLDEVVVVGHATQRKISVVGAVTNVEVKDLNVPATSVSNMLGARVPGIIAVTRSGEPGKDFSEFWIRGISTFGASSGALVLIDGVEGDLNLVDPEDIESFSILKDASATAVYGTRGANGVVLVTTKKGVAGKLKVNVKANVGLSYSPRMPEYVGAYEYATLANEAALSRGMNPIFSDVDMALFKNGMDPDLHPDVNWRDVILKDYTWNQQYHLSASGGGEVARYYMSMGFQNKEAIFKQDKGINKYDTNVNYKQYNFRANIEVNMTKSTILNLNLETILVNQNSPGYGDNSDALWEAQANLTPVTVPILYSTGQFPTYGTNNSEMSPYILLNHTGYRNYFGNTSNLILSLRQDLSMLTKGLSATVLFNFNSNGKMWASRSKTPELYYATERNRDGSLNLTKVTDAVPQGYSGWEEVDRKYYFEARANYERLFNKTHRVTGLIHFYLQDYVNSKNKTPLTAIPKRYVGLSSRLTYSWKDTYLIEANLGYTGSEAFENGKKFGLFPAISGGWIPTQYQFMKDALPFLSYLKFRASYGEVGNDKLTWDDSVRFPYLTIIGNGNSGIWNSGSGLTETQVGSNNLRWEKAAKTNFGIDMKLFGDRFDMTVDFFKDVRSGIYQQRASTPGEMGLVTLPWANVGKMKSWGIDGHVAYTHTFTPDTYITVRANFTQSKNEILEYEESIKRYPYQSAVGYQSGINRGLIALGLFKDEADIENSPQQNLGSVVLPGDIKYKDVNGDGVVDDGDVVPLEYSNTPQIQYGLGTEFNYKNWNLSVLFEGTARMKYFVGGSGYYPFANEDTGNILTMVADPNNRWISAEISGDPSTENPNAKFPRLTYGNNSNNNRASTFWLRDGSYLRLKNVTLAYSTQNKLFKKVGIQNATFSLIGENLWLWDKGDKIFDPTQASSNGAKYPIQRVITLQCNLNF